MGDTSLVGEPVEELAPLTIRRVLLPLDGSAFAAAALHTARALSARFDAELATISVAAWSWDSASSRSPASRLSSTPSSTTSS
jgi:nucleotide-binding universal stress UspA family protein